MSSLRYYKRGSEDSETTFGGGSSRPRSHKNRQRRSSEVSPDQKTPKRKPRSSTQDALKNNAFELAKDQERRNPLTNFELSLFEQLAREIDAAKTPEDRRAVIDSFFRKPHSDLEGLPFSEFEQQKDSFLAQLFRQHPHLRNGQDEYCSSAFSDKRHQYLRGNPDLKQNLEADVILDMYRKMYEALIEGDLEVVRQARVAIDKKIHEHAEGVLSSLQDEITEMSDEELADVNSDQYKNIRTRLTELYSDKVTFKDELAAESLQDGDATTGSVVERKVEQMLAQFTSHRLEALGRNPDRLDENRELVDDVVFGYLNAISEHEKSVSGKYPQGSAWGHVARFSRRFDSTHHLEIMDARESYVELVKAKLGMLEQLHGILNDPEISLEEDYEIMIRAHVERLLSDIKAFVPNSQPATAQYGTFEHALFEYIEQFSGGSLELPVQSLGPKVYPPPNFVNAEDPDSDLMMIFSDLEPYKGLRAVDVPSTPEVQPTPSPVSSEQAEEAEDDVVTEVADEDIINEESVESSEYQPPAEYPVQEILDVDHFRRYLQSLKDKDVMDWTPGEKGYFMMAVSQVQWHLSEMRGELSEYNNDMMGYADEYSAQFFTLSLMDEAIQKLDPNDSEYDERLKVLQAERDRFDDYLGQYKVYYEAYMDKVTQFENLIGHLTQLESDFQSFSDSLVTHFPDKIMGHLENYVGIIEALEAHTDTTREAEQGLILLDSTYARFQDAESDIFGQFDSVGDFDLNRFLDSLVEEHDWAGERTENIAREGLSFLGVQQEIEQFQETSSRYAREEDYADEIDFHLDSVSVLRERLQKYVADHPEQDVSELEQQIQQYEEVIDLARRQVGQEKFGEMVSSTVSSQNEVATFAGELYSLYSSSNQFADYASGDIQPLEDFLGQHRDALNEFRKNSGILNSLRGLFASAQILLYDISDALHEGSADNSLSLAQYLLSLSLSSVNDNNDT